MKKATKRTRAPQRSTEGGPLRARTTMLGNALRRTCEYRGWSQGRLARAAGTEKSIVSRLESSKTRAPHDQNLEALARALDLPAAALKDLAERPVMLPPTEFVEMLAAARGRGAAETS